MKVAADADGAEVGLGMRAVRVSLGISQVEMAERLGISSAYLSPVERGLRTPSITLLLRFCELVDMPASDVLRLGEAVSRKIVSDAAEAERERASLDMRTSPNEKFDAANNGFRFQPRGQES